MRRQKRGRGGWPILFLLLLGTGGLAITAAALAVTHGVTGAAGRLFSWAELTASGAAKRLGVGNAPPLEAQRAMERLVARVLDPLRAAVPSLVVTSGYRSPLVNWAVGGVHESQHMAGEAADIKASGFDAESLARVILRLGLPFDQLIWYAPERGGHVHVSYTETRVNRHETLYAPAGGGYV